MNILTTNGLVGRFVTDWAGPESVLKRVNLRLGVPNYAGDTMVLRGRVESLEEGAEALLSVVGSNSLGDHVTAEVRVALPVSAES